MENFISPNYGPEKLESPTYEDLVDVFEDRMLYWYFLPAKHLFETQHCQIASVALLVSYFEMIEIYLSGKDSKVGSKAFFVNGFSKVFRFQNNNQELSRFVAKEIYDQVRCGFAHEAMFRDRVYFSFDHSQPLVITWPKRNDDLDYSQVESITINPSLFYESIQSHFEGYVVSLRDGSDKAIKQAFQTIVKLKWALDEEDRAIGMTEEEFCTT